MLTDSTSRAGNNSEASSPEHATLAHDHMPTGVSLPLPSEVPLKNGTLRAYRQPQDFTEITSMAMSDSSSADTSSVESPYGCYLATQPYSPTATFRSVYLYFPESIVEAAGNETKRVVLSLQAVLVEDSSAVAGDLEEAVDQRERTGVRYANCVIPAASGAQSLAAEQLLRDGEDKATWNALTAPGSAASKADVYEQNCNVQEVTICTGWSGNEYCGTERELVCSPSVPGGDGEGDGGPDGGDGDGGYPGGGSGPPGGDGDGNNDENCTHNPEPGSDSDPCDPCESSNPPSYCGSDVNENEVCPDDPLKDMDIRATGCAANGDRNVDGGRFGMTRTDENGNEKFHAGIDLLNDRGNPVRAAEGGTIWASGKATSGYGYYVIVKTGENDFQYYTHLQEGSQISEHPPGQDSGIRSIEAGTIVGKTDTTGNVDTDPCEGGPPHVHFEVRTGASTWGEANPVNPESHLGTKFNDQGQPTSDSCPM
jgi:hypothetical protein